MRDRLIELLEGAEAKASEYIKENDRMDFIPTLKELLGVYADHLLAEGVIVPPCKVGQTVYCIRYDKARKPFVKPLGVLSVTICGKGEFTLFTTREDMLGKTVFLTREEAERALERNGYGT